MKKLYAVAAMAVLLCLACMVMSGTAFADRCVDNGDGTVTDTQTNLMWTKNANPIGERNWHDAVSACSSFSIAGIGGWRLPSRDELLALYKAMSRGHPFTRVQSSAYWTNERQVRRFVDNGNGTVTDPVTGLMWTKDANPIGSLNWFEAMSWCSSFSISGIGGWRLPSKDELSAIYHAIKAEHPFFTGVQSSYYWSSTTHAGSTDLARVVHMDDGDVFTNFKTSTNHVWPVRAGQ